MAVAGERRKTVTQIPWQLFLQPGRILWSQDDKDYTAQILVPPGRQASLDLSDRLRPSKSPSFLSSAAGLTIPQTRWWQRCVLQLSEWFTSARSVRGAGAAHSSTLPPPSPSFLRPDEGGADIRSKGGVEAGRGTFPQSSRVSVSLRRKDCCAPCVFVSPLQPETAKLGSLGGETVSWRNALLRTHARAWTHLSHPQPKHLIWKLAVLFWWLGFRFHPPLPVQIPWQHVQAITHRRALASTQTCEDLLIRGSGSVFSLDWETQQWDELGSLELCGKHRPQWRRSSLAVERSLKPRNYPKLGLCYVLFFAIHWSKHRGN